MVCSLSVSHHIQLMLSCRPGVCCHRLQAISPIYTFPAQKNKATSYHLGQLKAKLAKLKRELISGPGGGGGGGGGIGFDVARQVPTSTIIMVILFTVLQNWDSVRRIRWFPFSGKGADGLPYIV
jgi:hypothetical protein